jgi:hypothetical protein
LPNQSILFFINEPGAANVIEPLIEKILLVQNTQIKIVVSRFVRKRFEKYFKDIIDDNIFFSSKHLELKQFKLIISGASFPPEKEIRLWKEAKNNNIPSIAILDQWMHYRERFCLPGKKNALHLPSIIGIMDDFGKKEMLDGGFPENILKLSGHPYLESIVSSSINHSQKNNAFTNILFLAEPRHLGKALGYNEHSILEYLIRSIQDVYADQTVRLTCKLHPRHEADVFDCYKNEFKNIDLIINTDGEMKSLILENDIITGMSSVSLIEAALIQKPIISIQIGLNTTDPFLFSRANIHPAARCYNDLTAQFTNITLGKHHLDWKIPAGLSTKFHDFIIQKFLT